MTAYPWCHFMSSGVPSLTIVAGHMVFSQSESLPPLCLLYLLPSHFQIMNILNKRHNFPKEKFQITNGLLGTIFFFLIYFWLRWVFIAARGLSLVVASGGLLFIAVHGLLLIRSTGSRRMGFSSCGSRALECRLSSCVLRALEHRLSSCGTRAQ